MLTISQVRTCDPGAFEQLAEQLNSLARDMDEAAEGIYERGTGELQKSWSDAAGQLAGSKLKTLAASYEIAGVQLRTARSVVAGLEDPLAQCKRQIEEWIVVCEQYRCGVSAAGEVTPPTDADVLVKFVAASAENALKAALQDAGEVDATAAAALREMRLYTLDIDGDGDVDSDDLSNHRTWTLPMGTDAALKEMKDAAPLNESPDRQRAWWDALTPEERQQYLNALPLEMAGMQGLPDDVREGLRRNDLGYDRLKMLQYARDNWNNKDIDWDNKNNCTNFVSLALEHAGLPYKGMFTFQDDAWGHRIWTDMPLIGSRGGYTDSWGGANAQHDVFTGSGSPEVSRSEARPGDVIYWTQDGENANNKQGDEHHAAIVTAVLPNGDILYTQHTDSAVNQSLDGRLPHGQVDEGNQTIRIVRVTKTW